MHAFNNWCVQVVRIAVNFFQLITSALCRDDFCTSTIILSLEKMRFANLCTGMNTLVFNSRVFLVDKRKKNQQ